MLRFFVGLRLAFGVIWDPETASIVVLIRTILKDIDVLSLAPNPER